MEFAEILSKYWGFTLAIVTLFVQAIWAVFTVRQHDKDILTLQEDFEKHKENSEKIAQTSASVQAKIETSIAVINEKLDNIVKTLEDFKRKR